MAAGFGFSVSDICMGLKIIKDSIGALNDTRGAAADYSKLVTEVESMQDGLEAVQDLQDAGCLSEKQSVALDRAVIGCQENVQDFLTSISKYQAHLTNDASGLESKFRKIKWALCKKEDVAKFREQLARQASSISMLVITFQAKRHLNGTEAVKGGTVVAKQELTQEDRMIDMLSKMSIEQRQCFMIVMKQNEELVQTVQDMRRMMQMQTMVPPQILLQQPIVLLDPFGRLAPFHLEFVDSQECFIAVMKARCAHAGVNTAGLAKLDNQEFSLEDTRRKRSVDLTRRWEEVWQPGEQYDMRMVFHRFTNQTLPPSTCPSCNEINEEDEEQVHCYACGLQYQKVQAFSKQSSEWHHLFPKGVTVDIGGEEIPYLLRHPKREAELKVFRPSEEPEDELFEGYRRVQIVSQSLTLLDQRFPTLLLIEDFVRFASLVQDVPDEISSYKDVIMQLQDQAEKYVSEQRENLPAFSSYSQVEQKRNNLMERSQRLRRDIDSLVRKLCEDPKTKELITYIKRKRPKGHNGQMLGYYTGVLTRMVSLSEFEKTRGSKSPKSVSREKMDWLLLDSRAN